MFSPNQGKNPKGKKIFAEKSLRAAEAAEPEPVAPAPPPVKEGNSTLNALLYALFNISSASAIVFANKAVFSVYKFNFPFALTLVHTLVTMAGMWAFSAGSLFKVKKLPMMQAMIPLPSLLSPPQCAVSCLAPFLFQIS